MKAVDAKNWCIENITPQSWSRIVLKTLPELRAQGLDLKEIENPSEELVLSDEIVAILNGALDALYQLKIEAEVG
ncbi:MAG: hypothetical protein RIF46_08620 [Cyclobacteriaceae bacterium]